MFTGVGLSRSTMRLTAAVLGTVLAVTLLGQMPALARSGTPAPTAAVQQDRVVPGHTVAPTRAATAASVPYHPATPVWPAASTVDVDLPAGRDAATAPVRAGTTPVWIDPAAGRVGGAAPRSAGSAGAQPLGRARVELFDHATARAAGIDGVLLRVARTDGTDVTAPVRVSVDYSAFRYAYGADWASRLRLIQLPSCVLTTPDSPACRGTVLPTTNDSATGRLSATVDVTPSADRVAAPKLAATGASGGGVLVAAAAGPSGGAGDYAATSLQSSGTWSAGGSSGDFRWNYALRTPPSLGGPVPSLALSYSSASVDGRMAASNNQPSWAGEGFELWPGYIERRYRSCADDIDSGSNNNVKTGDECWATDNATLSLAGHAGELIKDGGTPDRWHLRGDDGSYIRHMTGAGNGAQNGEWWVVTTTDGTQYWFGGTASANSTWIVPVSGNHANEPCHQPSFIGSFCNQAWRWNLDRVVDPSGNTVSYSYTKETNKYARNGAPTDVQGYDRGGYLTSIEYGTRAGVSGTAPMRVTFAPDNRCLSGCDAHDPQHWPDVPWDQECKGSPCYTGSPTFWTTQRLAKVTTELWSGTGTTYNPVTSWTLTHSFPDPGDGTRAGMVLDRIAQAGYVGGTTTVPDVTFAYFKMNNRVDPTLTTDHSPAMNWSRLAQINTESGARIEVTYSAQDCVPGSRMPNASALQDNTLRCYPVYWTPPGYTNQILDFFHKYVVQEVHEVDRTTPGNPTTVNAYEYVGAPAWHYTDDDGLVKAASRTWSGWRGYGAVRTRVGVGAQQTLTETRYFRGMHGDKLPSGNRSVSMPAVDMNGDGDTVDAVDVAAVNDEDAYAGMTRETIVYNGPGGAEVSGEVSEPWQSAPTASRTIGGVTVNARFANVQGTHSRLTRDGGRAPRTSSSHTVFDSFGMATEVTDYGDDAVTNDQKCTLTDYVRNADPTDGDKWLVAFTARSRAYAVDCARAKQPGLTADDVIADRRTYYDGATSITTPPTRGLPTKAESLKDWANGAPAGYFTVSTTGYDAIGRSTSTTDVRGNPTTTAYTQNAGGQVVSTVVTNVLGWAATTTVEPAFGIQVSTVDANGRITDRAYDGLGRLVKVWLPGRDKATQAPNTTYSYLVRDNAPTVVTTNKLTPSGGYVTSYSLYDGLLRLRQTQAARGDGTAGAIVADTFYDTAGRAGKVYASYLAPVTPGTELFNANEQADVPARTETTFDGAGRTIASVLFVRDSSGVPVENARTTTVYAGDRVDVTPPAGGTATSTTTDSGGRTRELRQYHGPVPTPTVAGSYDATTYTYDREDQLTKITDAAGNQWIHTFDLRGRQTETVDPDKGRTVSEFGDAGDLLSVTDARGVKLVYTYDALGRKTGLYQDTVSVATKRAEWFYDGLTNSRGQLTKSIRWDNGNPYTREVTGLTATYQPTAVKYTIPPAETGLAGSYTYYFTYLSDGSPETTRLPDLDGTNGLPTETITQEYTPLGQAKALKTSIGNSFYVTATGYTGYGEVGLITLQNQGGNTVSLSRTYAEGTRQLAQQKTSRQTAPTTLSDVRYDYDPAGNLTRISDSVAGDNQCYHYDYLRRLTEAWTPGNGDCSAAPSVAALGGPAKYWTSWAFDATGNRTSQVEHDTPAGVRTTTYTTPAAGAVRPHSLTGTTTQDGNGTRTAAYGYDLTGNTTGRPDVAGTGSQTIGWDPEGHVTKVTDAGLDTNYLYDADGNRLIRKDGTGKSLYLPGQELRYTIAGQTKSTTRYYTHAGTTVATRSSVGLTWLAGDYQGSGAITIDAATQAYAQRRQDPYGNPRGTATGFWPSTMDKGFVGGTKDNTGLTHLGAREYDPATGRFISLDAIIDYKNPQRLDGYAYGLYNPVGQSDPDGLLPQGGTPEYLDTTHFTVVRNGYRYYFTVDIFLVCRNNGSQCYGGYHDPYYGDVEGWISRGLVWDFLDNAPGAWLMILTLSRWTRVPLNTAGPVAPPPSLVPRQQQQQPPAACVTTPVEPEQDHCSFFDFGCLFSSRAGTWWRSNKDWVTGIATVAGAGICIAATAGVCAIASTAGMWVAMGARTADFVNEGGYKTAGGWGRFGVGLGIDFFSARIPGVRSFKLTGGGGTFYNMAGKKVSLSLEQEFGTWGNLNRQALLGGAGRGAAQLGWAGISGPSAVMPWQMGVPWTNPAQW